MQSSTGFDRGGGGLPPVFVPPPQSRVFEYNHVFANEQLHQINHDGNGNPTAEPSPVLDGPQGAAHLEAGSNAPPNNHAAPPNDESDDDDIQYLGTSKLPELPPMVDNVDPYVLELVTGIIERLKILPQDSEEFLSLRRRLDVPYMRAALHKYNRIRPAIHVEKILDHSDEEPDMPPTQQQQQQPLTDQQPPTTTNPAAASGVGGVATSQPQASSAIPSQLPKPPVTKKNPSARPVGVPALMTMAEIQKLRRERMANLSATNVSPSVAASCSSGPPPLVCMPPVHQPNSAAGTSVVSPSGVQPGPPPLVCMPPVHQPNSAAGTGVVSRSSVQPPCFLGVPGQPPSLVFNPCITAPIILPQPFNTTKSTPEPVPAPQPVPAPVFPKPLCDAPQPRPEAQAKHLEHREAVGTAAPSAAPQKSISENRQDVVPKEPPCDLLQPPPEIRPTSRHTATVGKAAAPRQKSSHQHHQGAVPKKVIHKNPELPPFKVPVPRGVLSINELLEGSNTPPLPPLPSSPPPPPPPPPPLPPQTPLEEQYMYIDVGQEMRVKRSLPSKLRASTSVPRGEAGYPPGMEYSSQCTPAVNSLSFSQNNHGQAPPSTYKLPDLTNLATSRDPRLKQGTATVRSLLAAQTTHPATSKPRIDAPVSTKGHVTEKTVAQKYTAGPSGCTSGSHPTVKHGEGRSAQHVKETAKAPRSGVWNTTMAKPVTPAVSRAPLVPVATATRGSGDIPDLMTTGTGLMNRPTPLPAKTAASVSRPAPVPVTITPSVGRPALTSTKNTASVSRSTPAPAKTTASLNHPAVTSAKNTASVSRSTPAPAKTTASLNHPAVTSAKNTASVSRSTPAPAKTTASLNHPAVTSAKNTASVSRPAPVPAKSTTSLSYPILTPSAKPTAPVNRPAPVSTKTTAPVLVSTTSASSAVHTIPKLITTGPTSRPNLPSAKATSTIPFVTASVPANPAAPVPLITQAGHSSTDVTQPSSATAVSETQQQPVKKKRKIGPKSKVPRPDSDDDDENLERGHSEEAKTIAEVMNRRCEVSLSRIETGAQLQAQHQQMKNYYEYLKKTYYHNCPPAEDSRIPCKACQRTVQRSAMVQHYLNDHSGTEVMISRMSPLATQQARIEEPLTPPSYPRLACRFCDAQCEEKTDFYDHCTFHTGEFRFECPVCPYRSYKRHLVGQHARMKHKMRGPETTAQVRVVTDVDSRDLRVEAHVCSLCNFVQMSKQAVERHVNTKHAPFKDVQVHMVNLAHYPSNEMTSPLGHDVRGARGSKKRKLPEQETSPQATKKPCNM